MFKKTISLILGMGILFSSSVLADTVDENKIPKEFIKDSKKIVENWNSYMPSTDTRAAFMSFNYTGGPSLGNKGDVLVSFNSITGHAGLCIDWKSIIEANADFKKHNGEDKGGVAIWDQDTWNHRYTKMKGVYVEPASSYQKSKAVEYALDQLGEPYDILSSRSSEDKWYCSKLVWKAYLTQGINIEHDELWDGTHVTPGDLVDDDDTVVYFSTY